MTWPPALEATRWQLGKLNLPAIRSDKEEFGVTHRDILGGSGSRIPRVAKEGCSCINVRKAGLSPLSGAKPISFEGVTARFAPAFNQ
jgi:hypothetical protein